ncbi:amidohydrolase family protein [Mycobacterium palustre]|uniref:2-amino-3-carboxymuconate-6-semialdehyde decarboxylase n=1 Tax=Mycobacterium palustre TaxID=153971 RepID=A0A1X1ZWS3_9MYCO|nr:amidohydrolase family protein [Mycobacterium palustre]ORW28667.1 aminocarboxymuconate-semialdehyde decarboxylase [Mycobacterium palustre]
MHTHAIDGSLPDLAQRFPGDRWPTVQRLDDTHGWLNFDGERYRRIDHRCWSPTPRLADMDRDGVALQVVSPIPVTFCYEGDAAGTAELAALQNDFFARMVSTHPARFAALGSVPLQDPDLAVEELRRCMDRPGFLGVEIGTRVRDVELCDERFDRFFAVAHELNALILLHPSDQDLPSRTTSIGLGFGAGMPTETGLAAATLIGSGALARRPRVRLCLAHGAGTLPALIGRLDRAARIAGVAADSAELPSRQAQALWCDSLTYNRPALLAAVDVFGAEHVMFGSDYPFPAMPEPIDDIVADLPPELRRRISRTNAEEHYGPFPRTGAHALPAAGGH